MLKKNTSPGMKSENNSPDKLNRLVEGTSIVGDIKANSNFRIDGTLEGTITIKGKLVIGPSGLIKGDVICDNADVEGTIDGNIKVTDILSLKNSAKILGNIQTGKLSIEPGANFTGTCDMGGIKKTNSKTSEVNQETADVVY